jgi:MFS transporter, DHA1 family, multidrug resistance protein
MKSRMAKNTDIKIFLRTTAFGEIVRFLSGNRLLPYPDEIDPNIWRKSIRRNEAKQANGLSNTFEEGKGQDAAAHDGVQNGILLVDWYGPDDPEVSNVLFKIQIKQV